jgi:hypothetical protein
MQLVVGESVLVEESLDPYEALRVFFELAEERGHAAPSVVVDERGTPLTHPDYADRMGTAHLKAGAWAFCRRPTAEALGLPSGTDWVRDHSLHLMFTAGSPYLPQPHLHDQLYVQRFGDARPLPLAPVSSAGPVAWNNEGSRICFVEERLGHLADGTGMAGYVLWEYEVYLGRRRRVAEFPASMSLGFSEVSYSSDDTWIHLCQWAQGRNFLVRVADGLMVTLPFTSLAAGWNPRGGPSAMIVMVPDPGSGRLVIYDYDLSANKLEQRSDLESPTGLPLSVRELSMSADGYLALVTAPVGVSGIDQGARGGVHVAALIDVDDGTIEPVLPVRFRTNPAQRRHTSPRWCSERIRDANASVVVADQLLRDASAATCDPDSPTLAQDFLGRWTEVLDGITTAWSSGRMPPTQFADEYVQYALGCFQLDEQAGEQAVARLRSQAHKDPFARTIARAIDAHRERGWWPTTALSRPLISAANQQSETDASSAVNTSRQREQALDPAFDQLIAAQSLRDARAAGQELSRAASAEGTEDGVWRALAKASDEALALRRYQFVAKVGLGTVFWHDFFRPDLATTGLPQVPQHELLAILLNCFEACTHLPERTVIGHDAQSIFDAEDTRNRCQDALTRLPIAEYLNVTLRPRLRIPPGTVLAPNPADEDMEMGTAAMASRKRVFVSYVHEDADSVDRLAAGLKDDGFDVWLDRTHLIVGMRWKSVIRKAIRSGDYFIACFSPHYVAKSETYMNEELNLAIERLRMMKRSRQWFIPIKLGECEIPDHDIGPGETLDNLQYLDFSHDWDAAMTKLIAALSPGNEEGSET